MIGGKAVLTFRAVDDDQARAMIDDQEGGMRVLRPELSQSTPVTGSFLRPFVQD